MGILSGIVKGIGWVVAPGAMAGISDGRQRILNAAIQQEQANIHRILGEILEKHPGDATSEVLSFLELMAQHLLHDNKIRQMAIDEVLKDYPLPLRVPLRRTSFSGLVVNGILNAMFSIEENTSKLEAIGLDPHALLTYYAVIPFIAYSDLIHIYEILCPGESESAHPIDMTVLKAWSDFLLLQPRVVNDVYSAMEMKLGKEQFEKRSKGILGLTVLRTILKTPELRTQLLLTSQRAWFNSSSQEKLIQLIENFE